MYVRKKKNKSGKISIQIIDKSSGKYKVIKTVGSSSDTKEVEGLYNQGKKWIEKHQGQLGVDFDNQLSNAHSFLSTISMIEPCGADIILGNIFESIGFSTVASPLLKPLVISRIVEPRSKLNTTEQWYNQGKDTVHVDVIYRLMDKLQKKHQEQLQQISYTHTQKILGCEINFLFYDVTTLYFEIEKEDDLRKTGFSKDGKHQNPQIVLGLLVSRGGYPLSYDIFQGKKYEGETILPVLESFKKKFQLSSLTVVADAGLLSRENINQLIDNKYEFILGARIKNESNALKEKILALKLKNGESAIIKKDIGINLIIHYSEKRAAKDRHNRKRGKDRLEKMLGAGKLTKSNINNRGYNKYLKMEGKVNISIDDEKFKEDEKWDGLKGYITNSTLKPEEVIGNYAELWKIEKAFRISKHDLKIRPIYHRLQKRIEAHICISFTAYKVYKELERILQEKKSSLSPEKVIQIAKYIYRVEVRVNEFEKVEQIIALNEEQQQLRKLFGF